MKNKTRQIIIVVSVFVIALASLGTVIGLLVNTGRLSEYSGGFTYTLSGSRATITGYTGGDTDIVVPDRVRGNRVVGVRKDAFASAKSVKSITFNTKSSSFTLADEAFKDLTTLEKVVLPSGLKTISAGAFSGCKNLRTVIIPDSVTNIGEKAFYDCSALKFAYKSNDYETEGENAISEDTFYMPAELLEIGASAFENCNTLLNAHFNKKLEKIGEKAFYKATSFTELTYDDDIDLADIGASAFQNTKLRSNSSYTLNFPKIKSIGEKAFANITTNFSEFKIASSITNIGANAFMGSNNLSTVVFEDGGEIETMGEGVFLDCTSLQSVNLPESLKEIPAKTFMGCTRLLYNNDFEIGKNVEKIGEGAFAIYTNATSATYTRRVLEVHNENKNFAITKLSDFTKGTSSSTYKHGLLTDAEGKVVYAYYGAYDKDSTNSEGKIFRFLDEEGKQITSIVEIKGYAFAGIQFEDILLPKTVKTFGEFLFYESNEAKVAYIEAIGWEWKDTTFTKKSDGDPEVEIIILDTTADPDGKMDEFKSALAAAGIFVGSGTLE